MRIDIKNGKETLKLTKVERETLLKAAGLCSQISKHAHGEAATFAEDAGDNLIGAMAALDGVAVETVDEKPEVAGVN